MSTPNYTFPSLAGLGWSVTKTPQFKTKIQKSVSGRELRLTYQPNVTWQFEVNFNFLRDSYDQRQTSPPGPGADYNELRRLMGFFMAMQGSLTPFNFQDPSDDEVIGQSIGTGDGTTTIFQLIRLMPGPAIGLDSPFNDQFNYQFGGSYGYNFNEPIIAPDDVTAVYVNGALVAPTTYAINYANGQITFNSAPASGAAITASFTYFFLCRFDKDSEDFDNFFYQLWEKQKLTLQSVLI